VLHFSRDDAEALQAYLPGAFQDEMDLFRN